MNVFKWKGYFIEDFLKKFIIMADMIETENSHAGFIAVHVGRLSTNWMNIRI
jgi:hypothetical protein